MDPMDIDEVTVVPDTPEKSANQITARLGGLKSQNWIPSSNMANHRQFNPPMGIIRSGKSGNHGSSLPLRSGDSSSNRNLLVVKGIINKGISHENKNSDNLCSIQNEKPLITSQSSSSPDRPVLDLTGRSKEKAVSNVVIIDSSPDSVVRQDTINLRKPSRQKRLVRNGCISPMNIAKGKQPVENFNSGSTGMNKSDYFPTEVTASRDHIPPQNIENYNSCSSKGKEVPVKNDDPIRKLFEPSTSLDRWKTTYSQNCSQRSLSPPSREVQHIQIEDDSPNIVGQPSGIKALREDIEDDASIGHLVMKDVISNTRPSRQIGGQLRAQSSRTNGRSHKAHITLSKRQKQGSTLSTHAECSRSAADDSEIKEMGSSTNESRSQLTGNLVPNGVGNIESVINIDEATPERQHISSHSTGCSFSNEDVRAAQVELDERLARELQEQFYNETFTVGANEQIDTHIALALQQEPHRTVSRGRRPASNPRGSSLGQSTSRSSLDLGHSVTHTGVPTLSRVTRMRNAFTGQPHTPSASRGRNSNTLRARLRNPVFPPSMDIEARMHILEALESISDMDVGNSFLQMQRDFNEDDYELLLALDDNNHEHAGATARQINSLPESTVQTESLEEACSICLETPTMGDVIRHLPCFHKFHKDCIDPWLRRRTSCPVCKSSVT